MNSILNKSVLVSIVVALVCTIGCISTKESGSISITIPTNTVSMIAQDLAFYLALNNGATNQIKLDPNTSISIPTSFLGCYTNLSTDAKQQLFTLATEVQKTRDVADWSIYARLIQEIAAYIKTTSGSLSEMYQILIDDLLANEEAEYGYGYGLKASDLNGETTTNTVIVTDIIWDAGSSSNQY